MILIIIMNDDYQNNDSGISHNRNFNYLKSQTLNCYHGFRLGEQHIF